MKKIMWLILFIVLCSSVISYDNNDFVSYFTMDNADLTGANPNDVTSTDINTTNHGATTGATGYIDEAFDYTVGDGDYVGVGDGNYYESLPAVTFGAIIQIDTLASVTGTDYAIMAKWWDGVDRGFILWIDTTDDKVYCRLATDTHNDNDNAVSTSTIHVNADYIVGCSWSATDQNIRVWINGTNEGSIARPGATTRANDEFVTIGSHTSSSVPAGFFDGCIDEVFLMNSIMSVAEWASFVGNYSLGIGPYIRGAINITEILITSSVITAINITDGTIRQTQDDTTTFNLTTNSSATCGMNRTNTTFTECSTTGGTSHICTLTTAQALSVGNNNVFWNCTNGFNNSITTNRTIELVAQSVNLSLEGYTTNITAELGSDIEVVAHKLAFGTVCVDIDHPSYGINYSCATNTTTFDINISWFRKDEGLSWTYGTNDGTFTNYDLNHGAITGATYTDSGVYGGAYEFDGVNDYIPINTITFNKSLSISAWVYFPEDFDTFANVFGSVTADAFFCRTQNVGDNLYCRTKTISGSVTSYINNIPRNSWNYITLDYDGTNQKTYLNGSLVDTDAQSTDIIAVAGNIDIGRNGGSYLNGSIDEIRIWNKSLTPTEIGLEMSSHAPVTTEGLVGWWSFNDKTRNATHTYDTNNYANFDSTSEAGRFDGVDEYVSTSFDINKSFSLSSWIKLPSYSGNNYIVAVDDTFTKGYGFQINMGTILAGVTLTTGYNDLNSPAHGWGINEWHNIIITRDYTTGNLSIYNDGILWASELQGVNVESVSSSSVFIGRRGDGFGDTNGSINNVGIWNRTLTQTEITQLYNNWTYTEYSSLDDGLVVWYPMDIDIDDFEPTTLRGYYPDDRDGFNLTFSGSSNNTFYVKAHQYDDVVNMTLNVTGYISGGTFPKDVKLYINDTFSNDIGDLQGNLTTFNDSFTAKNLTFTTEATQVIGYLRLPKNTTITTASLALRGFNYTYIQETAENESDSVSYYDGYSYSYYQKNNRTFLGWDVKHGTLDRYNITSFGGTTCLTDNIDWLVFRIWSHMHKVSVPNYFSRPQCYDGAWNNVGTLSSGGTAAGSGGSGNGERFHDNNYDTYSLVFSGYWKIQYLIQGIYSTIYEDSTWWISYPMNPWLEIGSVNGSRLWSYSGLFKTNNGSITDFTTRLQDELSLCTANPEGFCDIPVSIFSEIGGIIEVTNISIIYSVNVINPINVNLAVLREFLGDSSGFVNVPLTLESSQSGAIYVDDIKFDYAGGNKTLNVTAHSTDYTNTSVINITYYYSDWFLQLPTHIDYLEFIPKSPTAKNVTPYGQTSSRPIINITTTNYGGKEMNFTVRINESFSCGNDTLSLTNNKSSGIQLSNTSWQNYTDNLGYLSTFDIYAWSDFSCDYSTWYLWEPYWMFRGCCEGCSVCDDSTTSLELV